MKQISQPFIITGDLNSHNIRWGSEITDRKDKEIDRILDNDNLILVNDMEPTRMSPINGVFSNIDLIFANPLLPYINDSSGKCYPM